MISHNQNSLKKDLFKVCLEAKRRKNDAQAELLYTTNHISQRLVI